MGRLHPDRNLTNESEQELLDTYKELRLTEIPDLWDTIEKNLAPREILQEQKNGSKKIRIPFKHLALLTAALLVVVVLIPVVSYLGENQSSDDSSGKTVTEMARDTSMESSEIEDSESSGESDGLAGAYDAGPKEYDSGKYGVEPEEDTSGKESVKQKEDAGGKDGTAQDAAYFELSIEAEILSVREKDGLIAVEVRVVNDSSGTYETEQRLALLYMGNSYGLNDFTGTKKLRIQISEKDLNILEILP